MADEVSGFLELKYSSTDSEAKDTAGETTKTTSDDLTQRYGLFLNKNLYPYLTLNVGGLFERDRSKLKTDDTHEEFSLTQLRPFIDLTLRNPFYTAGIGYNKTVVETRSAGTASVTNILENYNSILGWRPEGLPSIDVRLDRTKAYDQERSLTDTVSDSALLSSVYQPVENLDLRYHFAYDDTKDELKNQEVQSRTQNGRATYSGQFLKNRISLFTSYNISHQEIEPSSAQGNLSVQVFPLSGLSAIDDTPVDGALNDNPALIDGNLTAGSGVNIGLPPIIGGDSRPRNIGVDFFNETEVDTLFVWVDRALPGSIANSFSWEIYISSDNLKWSLWATISPARFGTFQDRFELNFPSVKTRYIKAVVRPLSPSVIGASGFPDIFVTEIQAFHTKPAEVITQTTQILNLDMRTMLLETPSLFYQLSYWYAKADPSSVTRRFLSNGLSLSHRWSEIFSGSTRLAREDSDEETGKKVAYVYSATVTANPLKTLSHSLVYSGRTEKLVEEGSSHRNSIFLSNLAELYKGVHVNISGGLSFTKTETDEKIDDTLLNFGASLVPHRTLTLNLNYSDTKTRHSGGGQPSALVFSRRSELGATYNPFETVYLLASVGSVSVKGRTDTVQNYAANWSPFPGGALQFNLAYTQEVRPDIDQKDRVITPSLRWNITRQAFLDISYLITKSRHVSLATESRTFSANLRISF